MNCRHCKSAQTRPFVDLGTAPPSNSYVSRSQLGQPERWYPLQTIWCSECFLVQTDDTAERGELFSEDYAYFSSFSTSWLRHAEAYVGDMVQRFGLGAGSMVVEVASNDGYLLQYVKQRGIPCLGVEPTTSTAEAARARGLQVEELFFGVDTADALLNRGFAADLMAANNVLAHVPDINDFVSGFARLLKSGGVATFEFPHFASLVAHCQFDTIYHEHYSYLSLTAVNRIFAANGLSVFDVSRIPTHGGSLRVFAQRADTRPFAPTPAVAALLAEELALGMTDARYYSGFQQRVEKIKNDFVDFLITARRQGRSVHAYGAAAKGNTLINYAGLKTDLIASVADMNPAKAGKFMPGSRIPIVSKAEMLAARPDYVVILPWNLREEIAGDLAGIKDWGGKFVTAVPGLEIWG